MVELIDERIEGLKNAIWKNRKSFEKNAYCPSGFQDDTLVL
jgi:hypothetical protein